MTFLKRTFLPALALITAFTATSHPRHDLPPMMGWSSWNTYRVHISDSLICRQADLMVAKGLHRAGYTYINIDDGFQGGRAADGTLLTHPQRFPHGLRPVTDHVHALGLKAGIYTDAGCHTCGNFWDHDSLGVGVGMYGHDERDARFYFREMNFDFIKIDFCGGDAKQNSEHLQLDERERYTAIRRAIDGVGRPDVRINICRWNYPGTWVDSVGDSWRTTPDIRAAWSSVRSILSQNLYLSAYSRPGHYNDMDMLEVGRGMTATEDLTHFAMWCMLSSPLLIGCDLGTLTPATQALLTHPGLLALSQRPPYQQARPVALSAGCHVLVKDVERLYGRRRAVAVYNPADKAALATVRFADVCLAGPVEVTDVVADQTMGAHSDSLRLHVPAHGVRVVMLEGRRRLLQRRYEAEAARITSYQELRNQQAARTGEYVHDPSCSAGMKAAWLGGSAESDLTWSDVRCAQSGDYMLSVACVSDGQQSIDVEVDGRHVGTLTADGLSRPALRLYLKKGRHRVRLHNDSQPMPDVDYMEIIPHKG